MRQRRTIPLTLIVRSVVTLYPRRTVLGLALFVGQAFLYNALLFSLGYLLKTFFGISSENVPYYIAIFAVGNLLGPLTLGAAVRHRRAQADDRRHLHPLGHAADRAGAALQRRLS